MYSEAEVSPKEQEEIIQKIAQTIHKHGLDMIAILMIESFKPLSFIGAQMGRLFVSPFLPMIGSDVGINGEKFFQIFEKRENVEKLIQAVENLTQEEKELKKADKAKKLEEKKLKMAKEEKPEKKGWRYFLPF